MAEISENKDLFADDEANGVWWSDMENIDADSIKTGPVIQSDANASDCRKSGGGGVTEKITAQQAEIHKRALEGSQQFREELMDQEAEEEELRFRDFGLENIDGKEKKDYIKALFGSDDMMISMRAARRAQFKDKSKKHIGNEVFLTDFTSLEAGETIRGGDVSFDMLLPSIETIFNRDPELRNAIKRKNVLGDDSYRLTRAYIEKGIKDNKKSIEGDKTLEGGIDSELYKKSQNDSVLYDKIKISTELYKKSQNDSVLYDKIKINSEKIKEQITNLCTDYSAEYYDKLKNTNMSASEARYEAMINMQRKIPNLLKESELLQAMLQGTVEQRELATIVIAEAYSAGMEQYRVNVDKEIQNLTPNALEKIAKENEMMGLRNSEEARKYAAGLFNDGGNNLMALVMMSCFCPALLVIVLGPYMAQLGASAFRGIEAGYNKSEAIRQRDKIDERLDIQSQIMLTNLTVKDWIKYNLAGRGEEFVGHLMRSSDKLAQQQNVIRKNLMPVYKNFFEKEMQVGSDDYLGFIQNLAAFSNSTRQELAEIEKDFVEECKKDDPNGPYLLSFNSIFNKKALEVLVKDSIDITPSKFKEACMHPEFDMNANDIAHKKSLDFIAQHDNLVKDKNLSPAMQKMAALAENSPDVIRKYMGWGTEDIESQRRIDHKANVGTETGLSAMQGVLYMRALAAKEMIKNTNGKPLSPDKLKELEQYRLDDADMAAAETDMRFRCLKINKSINPNETDIDDSEQQSSLFGLNFISASNKFSLKHIENKENYNSGTVYDAQRSFCDKLIKDAGTAGGTQRAEGVKSEISKMNFWEQMRETGGIDGDTLQNMRMLSTACAMNECYFDNICNMRGMESIQNFKKTELKSEDKIIGSIAMNKFYNDSLDDIKNIKAKMSDRELRDIRAAAERVRAEAEAERERISKNDRTEREGYRWLEEGSYTAGERTYLKNLTHEEINNYERETSEQKLRIIKLEAAKSRIKSAETLVSYIDHLNDPDKFAQSKFSDKINVLKENFENGKFSLSDPTTLTNNLLTLQIPANATMWGAAMNKTMQYLLNGPAERSSFGFDNMEI